MIVVCPRSRLGETLSAFRPGRVVSMRSPEAEPADLGAFGGQPVLTLVFNDVAEDRPDLVSPTRADVERLIGFVRAWDRASPLLIHCFAGISRSPAAALIAAAALEPDRDERELALTLRRLSPAATPNPYLVRLADEVLAKEGRMVRAVASIGRGEEAFEGLPFVLTIDGRERQEAIDVAALRT